MSESSLWSTEEARRIFGDGVLPDLNVRAEKMLSHWNSFEHKALINNKQFARKFIKTKEGHKKIVTFFNCFQNIQFLIFS